MYHFNFINLHIILTFEDDSVCFMFLASLLDVLMIRWLYFRFTSSVHLYRNDPSIKKIMTEFNQNQFIIDLFTNYFYRRTNVFLSVLTVRANVEFRHLCNWYSRNNNDGMGKRDSHSSYLSMWYVKQKAFKPPSVYHISLRKSLPTSYAKKILLVV